MASLLEIQTAFAHALVSDDTELAATFVLRKGIEPADRISIYRNNVREGFIKALTATCPAIVKLGGEDWFRQTALRYWKQQPSSSGDLHFAGQSLAEFLTSELNDTPYLYFADVAKLEWLYHDVLVAADAPRFDIQSLASIDEEQHEQLIFDIHPAVRWMNSTFPVFAIWNANRAETDEDAAAIKLDAGPSRVLLIRREDHIEVREVTLDEYSLLEAFASGTTLGDACEALLQKSPEFDLPTTLLQLARWGALSNVRLPQQ